MSKRCDVVYTLKNYVKPLMQLMTNDVTDYNMRLLTTKCLNTSVMIIILMLGPKAQKMADYCDTYKTIARHEKTDGTRDDNIQIVDALTKDMLNTKNVRTRYLYYILITDAWFIKENQEKSFFPGHVVVIEKFPGSSPYFYLYQSYINQYSLHGHFEKSNNSVKYTVSEMKKFLCDLKSTFTKTTWDDDTSTFWKRFTFVDTDALKGFKTQGQKFYLCYQRAPIKECNKNIMKYVATKLKKLNKGTIQPDAIYGDASKYEMNENPLTNIQMKAHLEKLALTMLTNSSR